MDGIFYLSKKSPMYKIIFALLLISQISVSGQSTYTAEINNSDPNYNILYIQLHINVACKLTG
jgi:hypothetical protein